MTHRLASVSRRRASGGAVTVTMETVQQRNDGKLDETNRIDLLIDNLIAGSFTCHTFQPSQAQRGLDG